MHVPSSRKQQQKKKGDRSLTRTDAEVIPPQLTRTDPEVFPPQLSRTEPEFIPLT